MWVPGVITNTVTMGTNLVRVNQRAMEVVSEPKDLIGNENNRVAARWARVSGGTSRDGDIRFGGVIRGKRGNSAIFAGEFEQTPIRSGTNGVRMIIDFVGAKLPWGCRL